MNLKSSHLVLVAILASGLTACTYYPPYDAPDRDDAIYRDRYGYSDYDYYYYPGISVYFQIRSGYYYYPDHGRWLRVRELPPTIHLDRRWRRHIVVRDAQPYLRHDEHERIYGSRQDHQGDPDADRSERDSNRRLYDRDDRYPVNQPGDRRDREQGPGKPSNPYLPGPDRERDPHNADNRNERDRQDRPALDDDRGQGKGTESKTRSREDPSAMAPRQHDLDSREHGRPNPAGESRQAPPKAGNSDKDDDGPASARDMKPRGERDNAGRAQREAPGKGARESRDDDGQSVSPRTSPPSRRPGDETDVPDGKSR
ncbi:MAG: hypothetical protein HGA75_09820 [Thiobacillus sp.]|nr:hypothetical protein [Thiobacillus sp.]